MRRCEKPKVIVHFPKNQQGIQELATRVAEVHADAVNRRIRELNCPSQQKSQLLDAVIDLAKQRALQGTDGVVYCKSNTKDRG